MNDLRSRFADLENRQRFTPLAAITLSLWTGLNTAIFRLIDYLFLQGLSVPEAVAELSR
jgi:hypothetical protein